MTIDIEGVERYICGFSKAENRNGNHVIEVEYPLNNISLNELRKIFNVDITSDDPAIVDMIYPITINAEQAKSLNKYVVGASIDTDKYYFELQCWEKNK